MRADDVMMAVMVIAVAAAAPDPSAAVLRAGVVVLRKTCNASCPPAWTRPKCGQKCVLLERGTKPNVS